MEKILIGYGEFFLIENPTKGADAIVVLGGNDQTRVKRAIELKKQGYAKRILMTTTKEYSKNYSTVYKTRLQKLQEVAFLENESFTFVKSSKSGATSTFDEAYDIGVFAKNNSFKRLILVTDIYHTRRASYAFKKVFSLLNIEIEVESSGAKNGIYNSRNWYKTEVGLSHYIPEGMKFLLYQLTRKNIESVKEY